jgi:hypothetical protein
MSSHGLKSKFTWKNMGFICGNGEGFISWNLVSWLQQGVCISITCLWFSVVVTLCLFIYLTLVTVELFYVIRKSMEKRPKNPCHQWSNINQYKCVFSCLTFYLLFPSSTSLHDCSTLKQIPQLYQFTCIWFILT